MFPRKMMLCAVTMTVCLATTVAVNVTPNHVAVANTSHTPIKHLIVIVDENHSFDNVFGTYPNASGFIALPGTPKADGIPANAYLLGTTGKKYHPYLIQSTTVGPLLHGYQQMVNDYNDGHMNGFVIQNEASIRAHDAMTQRQKVDGTTYRGVYAGEPLGHYDYHLMGTYWDYAQHFAMADHWFQPVFGPTSTNMMYLVAGRAGVNGHNVYYTGKPYEHFTFPNIGDEMSHHKISWTWYQAGWNSRRSSIVDNPFMFFRNYSDGKYNADIRDIRQFSYNLSHNQLSDVSFIKPPGELDEHPGQGSNLVAGEAYTAHLIDDVMASKYWDSTAIVLTFDESGGWWDHVTPPTVRNVDGLQGDGPRIPMILISPYARQDYVSHQIYNTDSILRFIEYNWHLPALTTADAKANDILPMFNFQNEDSLPLFISVNRERAFPHRKTVNVIINNFNAAQTGTYAPFASGKEVYMSLKDLERNFNLNGVWVRAGSLSVSGSSGSDVVSVHKMVYDGHGNAYLPLELIANKLNFRVDWKGKNEVQIKSINVKNSV